MIANPFSFNLFRGLLTSKLADKLQVDKVLQILYNTKPDKYLLQRKDFMYYQDSFFSNVISDSLLNPIKERQSQPPERILMLSREIDFGVYSDVGVEMCILIDQTLPMQQHSRKLGTMLYDMLYDTELSIFRVSDLDKDKLKKFRFSLIHYDERDTTTLELSDYFKLGSFLDEIDSISANASQKALKPCGIPGSEAGLLNCIKALSRLQWMPSSRKLVYHFYWANKCLGNLEDRIGDYLEDLSDLSQLNYGLVVFNNKRDKFVSLIKEYLDVDLSYYDLLKDNISEGLQVDKEVSKSNYDVVNHLI